MLGSSDEASDEFLEKLGNYFGASDEALEKLENSKTLNRMSFGSKNEGTRANTETPTILVHAAGTMELIDGSVYYSEVVHISLRITDCFGGVTTEIVDGAVQVKTSVACSLCNTDCLCGWTIEIVNGACFEKHMWHVLWRAPTILMV